jgi:hypothetical protein
MRMESNRRPRFTSWLGVALVLSIALGSPALAAPRDPRLIQGTLEWPPALSGGESFIVLRGDDGRVYYADVAAAQRRVQGEVGAGSQMAILGLEGARPHEVLAVVLVSGDARALISLALPQATPTAATTSAAPASTPTAGPHTSTPPAEVVLAAPPAEQAPVPLTRPGEGLTDRSDRRPVILRGSVFGVAGRNLFIREDDGTYAMVDISKVLPNTAQQLKPGSPIALIAIPVGKQYLATGFADTKSGRSGSTPAKPVR